MKRSTKSRKILLAVSALAIIVVGVGIFVYSERNSASITTDPGANTGDINYQPPTAEEKQEADTNKQNIASKTDDQTTTQSESTTDAKKKVTPVISYHSPSPVSSDLQVNGYVPSVIETDGTCTLSATKSGTTVTASRPGLNDAQGTTCGLMTIAKSKLTPGTWSVVLSYSSPHSSGSSSPLSIEVK